MNRKAFWLGFLATLCAIATQTYLAMTHFEVKFGEGVGSHSICKVGEAFDCSAVAASTYSEFMGVPMAIWGVVANAAMLVLALAYYFSDEKSRSTSRKNLLLAAGFIALTSIVMGSISTFLVGKYCLFCMTAYVLSFVSFAGFWWATRGDRKPVSVVSGQRYDAKPLAFVIAGSLIAGLMINYGWVKSYGAQNFESIVKSSVAEWSQNPQQDIKPVAPAVKGADQANAKMTIVEFADFLCPHCRAAGPTLNAFVAARKDVRYLFIPWPLDGECNSKISVNTGMRCGLARFSYCASKLSPEKTWPTIEWIYDHQEDYRDDRSMLEPTVNQAAKDLGLDAKATMDCVNSDEAKDIVQKQADLGGSLNIEGTPTIFVNGKLLPAGQVLPVLKETYNRL